MGGCASVQQPSDVRDRERSHPARPVRAPIHVKPAVTQQKQPHPTTAPQETQESEGEGAGTRNDATTGTDDAATGTGTAVTSPCIPEVTVTAASSSAEDTTVAPAALSPMASPAASSSSSVALVSEFSPSASSPVAFTVAVAVQAPPPMPFGTEPLPPAAYLALLSPAAAKSRQPQPLGSKASTLWYEILSAPGTYARANPHKWTEILTAERIPPQFRSELWARGLRVNEVPFPVGYTELLRKPCSCDDQISRDIHRTFSDHAFFARREVQRALGRILHATALFTPGIGYVQGLNYMAAQLLWVCMDEEQSWRMMGAILAHPSRGMAGLYGEGLRNLIAQCAHLDRTLLPLYSPLVAAHLHSRALDALMFATPLYLTLFTHHLNLEACKHVWDFLILALVGEEEEEEAEAKQRKEAGALGGEQATQQENGAGEEKQQQAIGVKESASSPVSAAAASSVATLSPSPSPSSGARGRGNSVSPLPPLPPPLSLQPCPLSHTVTLLTLSLLEVLSTPLRKLTSMEKIFHTIQRLDALAKEKTRRRIFKDAMQREQQRRKQTLLANAANQPEG